MEIYIGRSSSWDGMTYPRVGQWPLSGDEEKEIIASYSRLLKKAFLTYEAWKQGWRNGGLDDYFCGVELAGENPPEKIYVVLGFHPEKITWSGEFYPYRLRIDVSWCSERKCNPAFSSFQEADRFAKGLAKIAPNSRFAVVEIATAS